MKQKKSLLPQILQDFTRERKDDDTEFYILETDVWFN